MTTAWTYWTEDLARRLSEQLQRSVDATELVSPPRPEMGDFAFACFHLAKERQVSPVLVAQEIAHAFARSSSEIASATSAGPYVNFTLHAGDVVRRVIEDVERAKGHYGDSLVGDGQQLLLEYAQPNTHKEIHVGHLRNIALGVSLTRILEANAWKVIQATYHGDVGAHVAKCLWYMLRQQRLHIASVTEADISKMLEDIPMDQHTGKYLGGLYTASTLALDEQPEAKEEVSAIQRHLESHHPVLERLWEETRRWSLGEMMAIFDDLGVRSDRQYLESEVVNRGQQMVDDLLMRGVAKESQGAIVVDLEEKKLGIFLIRKSDGTSLYATKDLALAELKAKEFPQAMRSLMLVDNRQSLYFQQLFETLRLMHFTQSFEFVGYDFVTLKSGAMSSRDGNVVTYQSFRESVCEYARTEILQRHEDWSAEKVRDMAWKIAMGGMKFGMLKQDSDKVFTFDLEQSLSFDGDTGPYCQYAATRLNSILKKAGYQAGGDESISRGCDQASEKSLALMIATLPARIEQAGKELRPCVIAQWCVLMAQHINAFYRDVNVMESSEDIRDTRLRLVASARDALARGLWLLGIHLPDEM